MKLVSWNTQWCRGLDGVVDPQRIVDGARALGDFDVLCLQEIAQGFDDMPGAPGDQPAQLAALLSGFRLFFGAAVDGFRNDGRRQRFGNLIATRLPVLQVRHHPLPWPADPGVASMPRMCSVLTVRDPQLGLLRIMCTHLEYYSARQRTAQARALAALHAQALLQAAGPPLQDSSASPFRNQPHTEHAILCGDFNLDNGDPGYAAITAGGTLHDAWPLVHGSATQPPTFRAIDRSEGEPPIACDFVFVSTSLAGRVRHIEVDRATRASDHQPLAVLIS